ncbi:MAG: hypothetical protein IJA69_04320 [Clostridia bacterium]|nr:hypothetical protein [Clostridia bacterium]
MDAVNFCRLLDIFGEEAAKQTLDDVNAGRCKQETIEKYLYNDLETKEHYAQKLKDE